MPHANLCERRLINEVKTNTSQLSLLAVSARRRHSSCHDKLHSTCWVGMAHLYVQSVVLREGQQKLPPQLLIQQENSGPVTDCVAQVQAPRALLG